MAGGVHALSSLSGLDFTLPVILILDVPPRSSMEIWRVGSCAR
jgi:hypothetical protein